MHSTNRRIRRPGPAIPFNEPGERLSAVAFLHSSHKGRDHESNKNPDSAG
jgi:hypothetical protein